MVGPPAALEEVAKEEGVTEIQIAAAKTSEELAKTIVATKTRGQTQEQGGFLFRGDVNYRRAGGTTQCSLISLFDTLKRTSFIFHNRALVARPVYSLGVGSVELLR